MSAANESGNRVKVGEIDPEEALAFPSVYQVVRNKRQNVVRVLRRERDLPWASVTRKGTSFLQRLPEAGSTCWSLHGVRGS